MKLRLSWPKRANASSGTPTVAVMGALRSGTNLVAQVLESHWNLTADFHAYGWKHAGVPVLAPSSSLTYPDLPIIWVCKDPHALALSMHRYLQASPNGRGISLEGAPSLADFLRSPITIRDSRLSGSPRLRFANPVQYWNHITWNLETLDPDRFTAIGFNYEDILSDPNVLRRIESVLPVTRTGSGPVELPKARMGRGKSRAKPGGGDFDPAAYTDKGYLDAFTSDDLAFVANQADPWLMQRRGYVLP
jgi:hypothetical protein